MSKIYSYEIDNYLSTKDFHLTNDDFTFLRNTSPQINWIKFESQGEIYSRYQIGTSDNNYWTIFIRNYNK